MNTRRIRRVTASLRARLPDGREVVIDEISETLEIRRLDGGVTVADGIKRYRTRAGEPVNRDEAGFTLARNGERLSLV